MSIARTSMGRGSAPCTPEVDMRCDERIEFRCTADEKRIARSRAQELGLPISTLMRRAMKIVAGEPAAISGDGAIELAHLRRRLNEIERRIGKGDPSRFPAIRADLDQVRGDIRRTIGRCS